jgi:hypothetical protein
VEEREKMVEKKKFSRRLTAALRTTRIGQDVVPPRYALPEIVVGCFLIPEEVLCAAQMARTT